jgi:transposase
VCKAVLDILKRHFMVVLIDEYLTVLTSQMCHSCYNNLKLIPRFGEPHEKYCTDYKCDVDRDIKAAKNILEVFCSTFKGRDVRSTCVVPTSAEDKCRCQQLNSSCAQV